MKKFQILALFLCVLMVSQSWIQAETNTDKDALKKQIKELKKQVEKLKKRIKTLEQQLKETDHKDVILPKDFLKLQEIPKGWKEYEFNGMKYYIIPLQIDSKKTNQQKK